MLPAFTEVANDWLDLCNFFILKDFLLLLGNVWREIGGEDVFLN
jgi:hypothetical protein